MITYKEAMEILNSNSLILKDEFITTELALNRIIAENIYSPIDLPLFRNSAMDGFALNSNDTTEASLNCVINFKVDKCLHAGEFINDPYFAENKCIEIMTGAKVPEQFDCVIPIEDVSITDKYSILINRKVKKNENIRQQGEDITKDELIILENKQISSEDIMLLSALGIKKIKVKEQIKIAIFSTGNEIIDNFEQELKNGQIYNSNRIFLQNIFKEYPVKVDIFPTLKDNTVSFQEQISNLIDNKYHLIISTGAVSKGKLDLIPDALNDLNSNILFHRVSIKPGKPILFAKCKENIYYFGTIRGLTRKQINKNVEKYNGLFEIEHLLHKKVETLSYGQKRIVATFIGMVCGSKCIVLDEVTEGLDVETKLILSRMLREIKKEKIVILVSHDLEFIETCNDYNIFIKNGKIIEVNERTQDLRTIYDQYILATEGD